MERCGLSRSSSLSFCVQSQEALLDHCRLAGITCMALVSDKEGNYVKVRHSVLTHRSCERSTRVCRSTDLYRVVCTHLANRPGLYCSKRCSVRCFPTCFYKERIMGMFVCRSVWESRSVSSGQILREGQTV